MKRILYIGLVVVAFIFVLPGCSKKNVVLETDMGTIELKLYDDTPLHKENFIKLVKEGYYDGVLFHRVIKNFMIQSGDPDSRNATEGMLLGEGGPDYTIPAEILYPKYFHKRGVLAAAREGDFVNPEKASSGSQFYIVWGVKLNDKTLELAQKRIDLGTKGKYKLTPEIKEVYKTVGGTPHLDGQYTVFGEVVSGLDVVEAIQKVRTDKNDRPLNNVHIIKAYMK